MDERLSVEELAEIRKCTERNIRKLAKDGKIESEVVVNEQNRPKYVFPISVLTPREQKMYYKNNFMVELGEKEKVESAAFDTFSEADRKQIVMWIDILKRWQLVRNDREVLWKRDIDPDFVAGIKREMPNLQISIDTLYRKWNCYKKQDWGGMVDRRGRNQRKKTTVSDDMFQCLLYYFLDEAQHPINRCYEYMKAAIKMDMPEIYESIPHISSFRRRMKQDLTKQLCTLGRQGEKAYKDQCGFYIRREYEDMESNDYWIGDTHTFDVQSMAKDGSIHRLYLSAFMDARSGILTGWHIGENPSSQSTIMALRDGIIRCGAIPNNIYVDNGREFLTHDVGGLGHRAKKTKDGKECFTPPPIFARLGITMVNALVKNARAKTIERRFLDFKNQISRLFPTYTGGNVVERPEILKVRIKNGEVVMDEDLISEVNEIIEYYFNYQVYGGSIKADRGKKKIEVYNEHCETVRCADADELNLMLMRSSRVQTVGRRGIHLNINGGQLDFWSEDFRQAMFGKKVYFRYDPTNLSEVRVYDLEDKYVMSVPCSDDTVRKYGASKDDIASATKLIRRAQRNDKDMLKDIRELGYSTAREIVLATAMENKVNPVSSAVSNTIRLQRAIEEPMYNKIAVGGANLDVINRNAMLRNGGNGNG